MSPHARLAPSSAYRWINCPGSIRMAEGLPETPSVFAAEGTAAHALAEKCLASGHNASFFKGKKIKGFVVGADMVDGVGLYLEVVREISLNSDEFEFEQRLELDGILDDSGGTGDAIAYEEATGRVTIVDLKYGAGVPVEVKGNEQLLTYGLGVALRFHNRGVKQIRLIVVQPRAPHRDGPVREDTVQIDTLYEHALTLQEAAARVADPEAPLNPGPWCKFCKAAAICPALQQHVFDAAGAQFDVLGNFQMDDPTTYDAEKLANALRNLPLVMTYYKGVEQFAHAEALRGHMPPGFKLVAKRATRKWKNDEDAAIALAVAGIDEGDIYETKVRSPAQVEKAIPKKERATLIGELAIAQSSGTSLAVLEDPRPACDPNDARGFEAYDMGGE